MAGKFWLGLLTTTLVSCSSASSERHPPATTRAAEGQAPEVSVLAESQESGWDAATTEIATDAAAFDKAWSTMHRSVSPRPPLPSVAFDSRRVIFVAMGSKPTGGFSISFDSARATSDSLVISVTFRSPPSGCAVTQSFTSPSLALNAPKLPAALRVALQQRADTTRCD